jgi:hypothetical protein
VGRCGGVDVYVCVCGWVCVYLHLHDAMCARVRVSLSPTTQRREGRKEGRKEGRGSKQHQPSALPPPTRDTHTPTHLQQPIHSSHNTHTHTTNNQHTHTTTTTSSRLRCGPTWRGWASQRTGSSRARRSVGRSAAAPSRAAGVSGSCVFCCGVCLWWCVVCTCVGVFCFGGAVSIQCPWGVGGGLSGACLVLCFFVCLCALGRDQIGPWML